MNRRPNKSSFIAHVLARCVFLGDGFLLVVVRWKGDHLSRLALLARSGAHTPNLHRLAKDSCWPPTEHQGISKSCFAAQWMDLEPLNWRESSSDVPRFCFSHHLIVIGQGRHDEHPKTMQGEFILETSMPMHLQGSFQHHHIFLQCFI